MRVALVVAGGVDESGRERVVPSLLWLLERLARRHDVHVFVLRYLSHPRSYPLLGANIHDLGRPDGFIRQQRALHTALRKHGAFDVIHAYWAMPAGLHGAIAAKRLGVPAVVTFDSGELVSIPSIGYGLQRSGRQRLAVRLTARLARRVMVCTEFQARLARAKGFDVDVIPLSVDVSLFSPPLNRVEGPPWRLIHVASLNKVKDQPLLLQSMRRLIDSGVNVHLDIAGEDTLNGAIQELARTLGVTERVTFHGFVASSDLVPLYQRSHLAVLTSRHEAAGVVTLEAAACGLPTVGTDVGYVADWSGERSVAVRAATPASMADAIAGTLADRSLRNALGERARAWAIAHSADWTASRVEQLYQRLL